jgi:hypothetical protein
VNGEPEKGSVDVLFVDVMAIDIERLTVLIVFVFIHLHCVLAKRSHRSIVRRTWNRLSCGTFGMC